MSDASTLPIPQDAVGEWGSRLAGIPWQSEFTRASPDTNGLAPEEIDPWMARANTDRDESRQSFERLMHSATPFLQESGLSLIGIMAGAVSHACPPPLPAVMTFVVEFLRFVSDRGITCPFVLDESQARAIAHGTRTGRTASAASFPDRVRLPFHAVRKARREEPEEAEWDPLEYRMGLAVEKYFERDNADPANSSE